jgi:hypothetical protein
MMLATASRLVELCLLDEYAWDIVQFALYGLFLYATFYFDLAFFGRFFIDDAWKVDAGRMV